MAWCTQTEARNKAFLRTWTSRTYRAQTLTPSKATTLVPEALKLFHEVCENRAQERAGRAPVRVAALHGVERGVLADGSFSSIITHNRTLSRFGYSLSLFEGQPSVVIPASSC